MVDAHDPTSQAIELARAEGSKRPADGGDDVRHGRQLLFYVKQEAQPLLWNAFATRGVNFALTIHGC